MALNLKIMKPQTANDSEPLSSKNRLLEVAVNRTSSTLAGVKSPKEGKEEEAERSTLWRPSRDNPVVTSASEK
jgi:hypothetical protein